MGGSGSQSVGLVLPQPGPTSCALSSWTALGLQSLLTYLPHQDELHPWGHKSKETLLPNLLYESDLVRAMRKALETLPLFLKWVDR